MHFKKCHMAHTHSSKLLKSVHVTIFHNKGHSFCKQCLQDIQFKKTRYSSLNLSKLARADISSGVSLRKQGTCADTV